jgi:nitroreductase
MELFEAIKKRKTYRGYKSDPIPEKILHEIMELAVRSPSWANTQPWEFAVVTGKKLDEIKAEFLAKVDEEPNPDLAFPRFFPEQYRARLPAMRRGPDADRIRDDKELRRERQAMGAKMYGCPCVVYIYTDKSFYTQQGQGTNVYPVFDCGLAAENIMLAAVHYGLGTTPAAQAVPYPDVVRKVLKLPESKLMVLGIFIGYPDITNPQYGTYSGREAYDTLVKFYK